MTYNPSGYSRQEADDFLSKAEEVNQKVADILSGKIDIEELDKREKDQAYKEKTLKELEEREKLEKVQKGRNGKGH